MNLYDKFLHYIQQHKLFDKHAHLLLAVSGGIDSVALCELCYRAGFDFSIAHANFQLRGADSERDEQFVSTLAKKYKTDFYVKKFDTNEYAYANKKSIEESARILRYNWFKELAGKLSLDVREKNVVKNAHSHQPVFIATAHHADDNIETVMMNFFRGTGIRGLRGILPIQSKIVRPLLFAKKIDLQNFVKEYGLEYVTDYTNTENEFTRNYFRNEIIPLVVQRFPEAQQNIIKNIERFGEVEIMYQQALALHLKKLCEKKGNEIHIPVLKLLKTVPLSTIVFEIISEFGFSAHQTEDVIGLLTSETGKFVQSTTHRIIKNRNWLIITVIQTNVAQHILINETDTHIDFEAGNLTIIKCVTDKYNIEKSDKIAQLDASLLKFPLLLRKWKVGDYFYPLGMSKKKKVGRYFSDQKLSLIEKENAWVLASDKKIIWLTGMRIDDRFKVNNQTKNILKILFTKKKEGE